MAASSKAVINLDSKATMHVHSSKAIVLATMRMAKSSKVAINHGSHKVTDAHNKAAIKVGVVIKTTATSTTMAAAIHKQGGYNNRNYNNKLRRLQQPSTTEFQPQPQL